MKYFWYITVVSHLAIVVGLFVALFVLPFVVAWYVALPLCVFIVRVAFEQERDCPLTTLENVFRRKLGRPTIRSFMSYYFWHAHFGSVRVRY